jgi:hypothetical protein
MLFRPASDMLLRLLMGILLAGFSLQAAPAIASPQDAPVPPQLNLLIANLLLERDQISDTIYLYEIDNDILLPLGDLARHLTLGVTVDPVSQVASGFILKEGAAFRLDPAEGKVLLPTHVEEFDPRQVQWIDGEIYVASRLLQRWWPSWMCLFLLPLRLLSHQVYM